MAKKIALKQMICMQKDGRRIREQKEWDYESVELE